ncbi:hypothetical protein [Aeromicrobium sp. CF3.5]|uniref:hypothetical protein n=1 Tax=Aeromicrobium sp. CF3.5 TaxID=3373078 RepID=UPI003EE73A25
MQVEVEHAKLVLAMRRLDDLATRIESESNRASGSGGCAVTSTVRQRARPMNGAAVSVR